MVTLSLAGALLVLPVLLAGTTALLSQWWSEAPDGWLRGATRFVYALVPLGAGMWLAHYSFHLFTSADTIVPVSQRLAADLGTDALGTPAWGCHCCVTVADWLLRLEILFLEMGLLASLYAGYRIALDRSATMGQALRAFAPWAMLMLLLFTVALWILFQPMEMRGTMPALS